MTLEQLLEQISLFVDEVRTLKEEKEAIELSLESYKTQISELETENSSLKEQANLNLIKVQEIVNELKEILNKE